MADEPPIKFREVSWEGPVVIPGPLSNGYQTSSDYEDHVDPADSVEGVDSPATSSVVHLIKTSSTIHEAISEGRIRDSLELKKYQPPNPLGIRRASQASAAVAAAAPPAEVEKKPTPATQVFSFRAPSTVLNGDRPRRRDGPSHALNIVQPYPNPYGLQKKRAAPIELGPFPERLLKRHTRGISVSRTPDGSFMVIKALDEEFRAELMAGDADGAEEPAGRAGRRISAVEDMVRKMRKDMVKDKDQAVPAQGGGDATKQQQQGVTEKAKRGYTATGKPLASVKVGESAQGKEVFPVGDQQAGGAQELRGGEQPGNATKVVRKVKAVGNLRKAFGRILKVTTA